MECCQKELLKDFKIIFYFGAGRIKRARSWLNSLQQKPRQAMAKRLREEACRSEVHRLGDDLWLRVRLADDGVGSLMLFQGRRIFECTQYKEAEDKQYTDDDWLSRFKKEYRLDAEGKTDEALVKENEKARWFSNRLRDYPLSSSALAGYKSAGGSARLEVVAFVDEGTEKNHNNRKVLKLKMEVDVAKKSKKLEIGHIKHISMLCLFEEVVVPVCTGGDWPV